MKRGKRLLILCLILVVSIGSFAAVSQYVKKHPKEEPEEFDSGSSYTGYGHLYEYEAKDIDTIRIQNDLDDFTLKSIVTKRPAEESAESDDSTASSGGDESSSEEAEDQYDVKWEIVGYEEWQLSSTDVNNTVQLAANLFANRMADEDAGDRDLADFGLDDPCSTITITYYDGNSQTIYVGDRTPDGSFCYGMLEGDDAIYTLGRNAVNTAEFTAEGLRYVASIAIDPEAEFYYIKIDNANGRNIEVSYAGINDTDNGDSLDYYNGGVWKYATGDGYAYPNTMFASGSLQDTYLSIPDVTISEQIEDNAKDLDQYGLGETPEHHMVLTYRRAVNDAEVSQAREEGYEINTDDAVYDEETGQSYWYTTLEYYFGFEYTGKDGTPMVYFRGADSSDVFGVEKSIVDGFDFEPFTYVQKVIYMNHIDNIATMHVEYLGKTYDIEAKRGETTVDEDGKEDTPVVYSVNGNLVNTKAFQKMYQALISLMADFEIYGEKPEIDTSDKLEIDYVFNDGSTHQVTYYRMNDFYYVTQVADDAWFACKSRQFDEMQDYIDQCINGPLEEEE